MENLSTPAGEISLVLDGPRSSPALVVLAHGAGGDMSSAFMEVAARGLAGAGLEVCRFNFAYMEKGKKAPDRQPVLEETYRVLAESMQERLGGRKLVLGGKSMGGRIASHIAASGTDCDGLVFLGYPLHPPGRPERLRDEHLRDVRVPMLFVEGTRDPFCPLPTLERVRKKFKAPTEVVVIDDGDHSFKVRKSSGRSTEEAWEEVVAAVARWVEAL